MTAIKPNNHAILVIAHGSRKQSSNDEVFALGEQLQQQSDCPVKVGFLELTSPTIQESLLALYQSGKDQITVLPYFLAAGVHVVDDIPNEIQQFCTQHPDCTVRLLPHLGATPALIDLLTSLTQ